MTQEHTIIPSQELVDKWVAMLEYCEDIDVFSDIARWGADQELEACCEWLISNQNPRWAAALQEGRRPKPPSLKQLALAELDLLRADATTHGLGFDADTLRRALESLPD